MPVDQETERSSIARPAVWTVTPGWHADPWKVSAFRWFDGTQWTGYVSPGTAIGSHPSVNGPIKPRLPSWLSVPVVIAALIVVPIVCYLTFATPFAVLLGLVPLLIVLPALAWLDRVEPEPRSAKIHALLWGATVAPLVAGIVNTIVGAVTNESIAAVVSAPIFEESMKGLGILWAVKRFEINDTIDGVVFAGWVALGFAVSEDFLYLAQAGSGIVSVFVVRALLTPFAHPLFTAWTGLAVGRAVSRGRSPKVAAPWGLALAMLTHAAWNGSLTWSQKSGDGKILLVSIPAFIGLFFSAIAMCVIVRNKERQRFVTAAPALAAKLGMFAPEIAVFSTWKGIRATRKALPRAKRRSFDAVHASLARLTSLQHRSVATSLVADQSEEGRHIQNLQAARARLNQSAPTSR